MDDSVYIFDARLLVDDGIGCTVAVLVLAQRRPLGRSAQYT
jgi:hypothetical protein